MEIDPRVARHDDVVDEGDRLAKPGLGDLVRGSCGRAACCWLR